MQKRLKVDTLRSKSPIMSRFRALKFAFPLVTAIAVSAVYYGINKNDLSARTAAVSRRDEKNNPTTANGSFIHSIYSVLQAGDLTNLALEINLILLERQPAESMSESIDKIQWKFLSHAFRYYGLSFVDDLDTSSKYLIRREKFGSILGIEGDRGAKGPLFVWTSVRDKLHSKSSDRYLGSFLNEQIAIEREKREIAHAKKYLLGNTFEIGFFVALSLYASLALLSFRQYLRRKNLLKPIRQTQDGAPSETVKAVARPLAPLTSTDLGNDQTRSPKKKRADSDIQQLRKDAQDVLASKIGETNARIIFDFLGKRLSNGVMRDILAGNFGSLVALIQHPKQHEELTKKGCDINAVIKALAGEVVQEKMTGRLQTSATSGINGKKERPHHPLDDVSRGGRKTGNFHRLLISHGFSIVPGKGGHLRLEYQGEIVRYEDNRQVIIRHKTGEQEVSPGLAGSILKRCAEILVEREQKSKKPSS